jgi:two-component system response regulator FixJ
VTNKRTIHLVDDEAAIRRSASFMLKVSGFEVVSYASGGEFLSAAGSATPGCVLLDIRMPGIDGLGVQRAMNERGIALPVIMLTGHGDVTLAVRAMKAGAVDFIEKPFEKSALLDAIAKGFDRLDKADRLGLSAADAIVRLATLTGRERDTLEGLVRGHPNKTIGHDLGISPRTVEIHRANLMNKLSVVSLSELLQIAFAAGVGPTDKDAVVR